jgi:uncharacterized membrane protein
MALVGRLHPLLVHFPIALVIVAAASEAGWIATSDRRWRSLAVLNVRVGAVFAVAAAAAGWRLASAAGFEPTLLLECHRWLGASAAVSASVVAAVTFRADARSDGRLWIYRVALFGGALLVAAAGHSGGLLVWGADFLRL